MLLSSFIVLFYSLCLFAAMRDIVSLIIPNWMNGLFVLLFLPVIFIAGLDWTLIGLHFAIAFATLILTFTLFAFNIIGGGDAKMIPAVILWMGPSASMPFLFGTSVCGGLLAIIILLLRTYIPPELAPSFAQKLLDKKNGIPYGAAILAGVIMATPSSIILSRLAY